MMLADRVSRVLITGASGFIGSNLVHRCVRDGISVTAVSRSGSNYLGVNNVRIEGYTDLGALAKLCEGQDAIIHLAAMAHQVESSDRRSKKDYDAANVFPAAAVASACRMAGAGRFVFVSSIGVNGDHTEGQPFTSLDTPRPSQLYARSKWEAELRVVEVLAGSITGHVIIRPPLVYGPGCPGNFAKLLRFVAKAPVIPLEGVTSRRTLVYIDNLVDALLRAASHSNARGQTFLVGDLESLTLREIVRILADGFRRRKAVLMNVPISILRLVAKLSGRSQVLEKLIGELILDAGEFARATSWTPPYRAEQALLTTAETTREGSRH